MAVEDLRDELDAFVAGDDEDGWPPDEPPPVPEDADGANRLLRRVRASERLIDEARAVAFAELERIQAWYDDRTSGLRRQITHTERSLEQWMRSHHDATGKKTVKLPNGEVKVREGRTSITVEDDAELVQDFIANGRDEWVRFKFDVDKAAMAKAVFPGARLDRNPNGQIAPEGYEWRQAMTVESVDVVCAWPLLFWLSARPLDRVAILVPTRLTFGFNTTKEKS